MAMIINTEPECNAAFAAIDQLIAEGFEGNAAREQQFDVLARAIEAYEIRMGYDDFTPPKPETLPAMIELKRQQKQLKQKDLATLLEISAGRLSQILNGKRRVSLVLATKLHERLNISPAFILRTA